MKEMLYALLDEESNIVVMPTQRSARALAAGYAHSRRTTIAADRVISFDSFSALFDEEVDPSLVKASPIVRGIFASTFLERKGQRLGYLYNPSFADSRQRFSSFIASILPSLGEGRTFFRDERLYGDIMTLKKAYADFMATYGFYEPAWRTKSVEAFRGDRSLTWCLSCPKAEVHMLRLLDQLGDVPFIRRIDWPEAEAVKLRLYENERAELAALFDALEELRRKEVALEDIILSTPDLDRLRPHLEIEAARRGIKLSFERELPLLSTKVGGYLCGIRELSQSSFSFVSLSRLLLDTSLPYTDDVMKRNRALIKAMVDAGVSSDSGGRLGRSLRDRAAAQHFSILQSHVRAIMGADDPSALQDALQGLGNRLFGQSQFRGDEADSRLYSYIMDRYEEFSRLASRLPSRHKGLFSLFLDTIQKLDYVPQEKAPGILVMQYSHDYQIHVPYRFVFGLSEASCRMEEGEYAFLQDYELTQRRSWDVGDALLDAYMASADELWLSGSTTTWDQAAVPPFHLSSRGLVQRMTANADRPPVHSERLSASRLWLNEGRRMEDDLAAGSLRRARPLPEDGLSYSLVAGYADCPYQSALSLFLHLRQEEWSVGEIDYQRVGNAMHSVMEAFLEKHRGRPLLSDEESLSSYDSELEELFEDRLDGLPLSPYSRAYLRSVYLPGIQAFPRELLARYKGIIPRDCEVTLCDGGLNGRIDARFQSGDETVLIDFKSSQPPRRHKYQLLIYKDLLDAQPGEGVYTDGLFYYSFTKTTKANGHFIPQAADKEAAYGQRVEMEEDIEATRKGFAEGRWNWAKDRQACALCPFATICRRRYVVR